MRATEDGWELEADPRRAELIVEQLGIKDGKGLATPGMDEVDGKEEKDEEELTGKNIALFRGVAARGNYLSMDRLEMQYAAKETCREMAKPTIRSIRRMKMIGRFL